MKEIIREYGAAVLSVISAVLFSALAVKFLQGPFRDVLLASVHMYLS